MTVLLRKPKGLPLAERFWRHVDKSGECWVWTGGRVHGYGVFLPDPRRGHQTRAQAHRVAYELTYGPIPAGLFICHRCDNPPCVRPEHLFAGTQGDNMRDAMAKGRHWSPFTARVYVPHGESHPSHRLTRRQVIEIRERHAAGARVCALGRAYGVSHATISLIVSRKNWSSVA